MDNKFVGRLKDENPLSAIILNTAFKVHSRLGPGLLESAYETVLSHELRKHSLIVETQVGVPIRFEDLIVENAFRIDILVERKMIVELKSVESLVPVHSKQLLTQLRLFPCKLGLFLNFGEASLKNGIERIINC